MIEFVFLDLDNTIFDFYKAEELALTRTLRHCGIEPTEANARLYSAVNDAQWKRLERGEMTLEEVKIRRFELFFQELGVVYDAEEARLYYEDSLATGHYFLEGAEEMLESLKGKYRLYIASNGITKVQTGRIKSAGIAPLFEDIFLSEKVGAVKPKKEFFDACFAAIPDFDRARAIILGDSLTSDILGGKNAGIRTCLFAPGGLKEGAAITPDYCVTKLSEFPELLERI